MTGWGIAMSLLNGERPLALPWQEPEEESDAEKENAKRAAEKVERLARLERLRLERLARLRADPDNTRELIRAYVKKTPGSISTEIADAVIAKKKTPIKRHNVFVALCKMKKEFQCEPSDQGMRYYLRTTA